MNSPAPDYRFELLFDVVCTVAPFALGMAVSWLVGYFTNSVAIGVVLVLILTSSLVTDRVGIKIYLILRDRWPTKPTSARGQGKNG